MMPNVAHAQLLSREAAVQLALGQNPEVIAAQKVWEAARARITQARALPDPELALEYEELPGVTRTGDFGERSFGATQTIEFPLKWWRRSQAASQAAQATRLAVLEMSKLDIRTRVKVAYDRVLFAQKRLDYILQDLQLAQNFLQKAQLRLEAGDVPQLEVLRAEVEAGRAANRLAEARNALSMAKAELNTLLARPSRAPLEMSGDLDYQPIILEMDKLQLLALERRPDFLGADWAVESSLSAQGTARAALLPDLNVGLFRQTIRGAAGEGNFWRVGLALDFPLWGAAQQRGELAEAKAVAGQAFAEKNSIRNQMVLEIESAFLDVQTAEKKVLLFQERILREAERSFEVASRSYAEGKATYLELLDAQKTLIEVREEYAAALFDYRSALYRLERASGGPLR
jgi:cobalt-zinc-cadmium efflux system outer membrane protein